MYKIVFVKLSFVIVPILLLMNMFSHDIEKKNLYAIAAIIYIILAYIVNKLIIQEKK